MKTFPTPEAKALYKSLRSQTGSFYEVRVIRDETVYGMNKLKSVQIRPALFEESGPQIGGVHSTVCEMTLIEKSENWPRMAEFEVQVRLSSADESVKSVWISQGTFYTDERKGKRKDLHIIAYDKMLMLEQSWTDKVLNLSSEWPVTSYVAALLICEATGIVIEGITNLDNTTPYIGLDTTSTVRDVMKAIAVGNGGNWYVAADGKYRLIILKNLVPVSAAIAGIAIAGISVIGDGEIDTSSDSMSFNEVGFSLKHLEANEQLEQISGVEITSSEGTISFAGDRTGYVLKAQCDYANSSIAELCLTKVRNYIYMPFKATSARIDPIAEIGDFVSIAGNMYPIITLDWNIAPHITADIAAPFEEEIDHEYQTMSQVAKTYRKALNYTDSQIKETRSYIQQTERDITQGIATTYVSNEALSTTLQEYSPTEQIQQNYYNKQESNEQVNALASEMRLTNDSWILAFSQLSLDVNNSIDSATQYIRFEDGILTIGDTESPISIRLGRDSGGDYQIGMYYNNDPISWWNTNQQYTPKELQIPTGGKFTLGKVLFQPRSSGNVSLMWVGD